MVGIGSVPRPPIDEEKIINRTDGIGYTLEGERTILGVCVHRMLGHLSGTDYHFRYEDNPELVGLTDFGIGNTEDGEFNGAIWQWNSLDGERAPIASGPFDDPEGHGQVVWEKYQEQVHINRDLASIETSGFEETPVSPEMLESLAWLIAWICDSWANIPHGDFPYNKTIGDDFYAVYQHFEFAVKDCPFAVMKGLHGEYVERAKEIMRYYQEGGTEVPPPNDLDPGEPEPEVPVFAPDDLVRVTTESSEIMAEPGEGGTGAMVPENPVVAQSRGSAQEAIDWAQAQGAQRFDEVQALVHEFYSLSDVTGIDAAILVAQSAHETANWTSSWWVERLNPAGIGITGDPAQNDASKYFADGIEAARAQSAHMHAYVYGDNEPLPDVLEGTDPRYNDVFEAGYASTVTTIADLATSWAVDPEYAIGISNRGNQIYTFEDSGGASPIGTVNQGEEFCIISATPDGQWVHVAADPQGWIRASDIELVSEGGCQDEDPDPEPVPDDPVYELQDLIIVEDGPLNLRSGAGLSSPVVGSADTGALFCVREGPIVVDEYTWMRVTGRGFDAAGWIATRYTGLHTTGGCTWPDVRPVGPYLTGDRIRTTGDGLSVRSQPGTIYTVLVNLPLGATMCVLDGPVNTDGFVWIRIVTTDGRYNGWVASEYTALHEQGGCLGDPPPTPPNAGPYNRGDRITSVGAGLKIRSEPGTIYTVIYDLPDGSGLCVLDGPVENDGFIWIQIRTVDGRYSGWVASEYTQIDVPGGCQ